MTISLSFVSDTLAETVQRSLSIIGKRSVDDKGKPLFKDITLSSAEKPILEDFFTTAIATLVADMGHFAAMAPYSAGWTVEISVPTNFQADLQKAVREAMAAHIVAYALYSWFTITAPRIAQKYLADANMAKAAALQMIHEKVAPAPPTSGGSEIDPFSISTTITNNS